MAGLPVRAVPGIGPVRGAQLNQNGIMDASQIYGQFLWMKRNEEMFIGWFQQQCTIGPMCARRAYNAFLVYSQQHL